MNIKLDKSGGLTEALAMQAAARLAGLKVMVGCMVSTSLAMAPALILAQNADWVDTRRSSAPRRGPHARPVLCRRVHPAAFVRALGMKKQSSIPAPCEDERSATASAPITAMLR